MIKLKLQYVICYIHAINENIINLIDREVVNCNYPKITSLANNYTNCIIKRALLKELYCSLIVKKNNSVF
jgi:hypothetical protein